MLIAKIPVPKVLSGSLDTRTFIHTRYNRRIWWNIVVALGTLKITRISFQNSSNNTSPTFTPIGSPDQTDRVNRNGRIYRLLDTIGNQHRMQLPKGSSTSMLNHALRTNQHQQTQPGPTNVMEHHA